MIYLKEFNTTEEYNAFVKSGAMVKPNVSLVNEPFTTYYNKYVPLGVFIQHVDGTLYTEADWTNGGFSNDEANGVAVITENVGFVMAKTIAGEANLYSSETFIEGIPQNDYKDYGGQYNTAVLISTGKSPAATMATNYVFPNGQNGYLPAIAELKEIDSDGVRPAVRSALSAIGAENIWGNKVSAFLSSTQGEYSGSVLCYRYFESSVNPYGPHYIKTAAFNILPLAPLDV